MLDRKKKEKTAVAVAYTPGERAPKILATGKGEVAERIIETAKENEVPLYEDDKLYYNDGKSDFTLKNFLKDPEAYYSDVTDDYEYYVYDKSLEEYTGELKKKGQALMENSISTPWKKGEALCSEAMAADLAQFMISFGKGWYPI